VIGGGAGVAPSSGTRSGNTTAFVTTTGSLTSGNCVKLDANGNFIDAGAACGTGSITIPVKRLSTNTILTPYFNKMQWNTGDSTASATGDYVSERYGVQKAGDPQRWFDYRTIQIFVGAGLNPATATYAQTVPIDLSQPYRAGAIACDGAGGNMDIVVVPLDGNNDDMTALTNTLTYGTCAALSGSVGELGATINANGGGAPAWPTGAVGARIKLVNNLSNTNRFVFNAYLIQTQKFPANTFTKANVGGGVHEGLWDGTNLFTISHTYSQLAKFDTSLNRVSQVTTSSYPHDIVALGTDLWVISNVGKQLQQINKAAMTITNTFGLNGTRTGFGIATDGTDLYLGIGDSGAAETPAIVKFTVAGSTQTVLSTDVNGGSANIPVQFLAGSIWSIVQANSQVKRYNTAGTTLATISCSLGGIYGLGNNGTLIFAQAEQGVCVVDPATNTVVGTYKYTSVYGMGCNMKQAPDGTMWGCTRNGVFRLDHANAKLYELPGELGHPKMVVSMPTGQAAGMVYGFYGAPWLNVYQ
jgi:hypothetical protein